MPHPAQPPNILCIGMPVRDLIFRVTDLPPRGGKVRAEHFDELAGGNALNAAVGIVRLGGRATFTGPMGDAGEKAAGYIFDALARENIAGGAIVHRPTAQTPISTIMIDPGGERTIITYRDPKLWDTTLPDAAALLEGCAGVLAESRCGSFIADHCAAARERGLPVVIDADNAMPLNDALLQQASHLIFSEEALSATAGATDIEAALRRIAAITPSFVAATRGPAGMIWLDDHGRVARAPAFSVRAVDTLGAGDIFHGAFALALAEGQPIPAAMRFAAAAAALKCTRFGGAFAAPRRDEVEAFLATSG